MRSLLIGLLIGVSTIATADPRDNARRIPCELQTAGIGSLPTLEFLQGQSPLIACDQYRSGKALTVSNDVQAVMRFSSSLTNTLWVSVTNQSYYSNSYLIQLPSLGTNAVNWVYTILYYKDGAIYWTGTGRLDIKKTEVAGSALQFVQVVGCITTNDINSAIATHNTNLTAHATLLSSYVTQAMTNGWTVSAHLDWLVRSETNGWVVAPHQAWLTAETDPIWAGVSNTVTAGALLGSTALQSFTESDSIALGRLTTHTNRTDNPHLTTAGQISVTFTPTNYTASAQNVEAHLGGIDSKMGSMTSTPLAWTPISTPAGANAFTASVTTARSIYDFTASAVNTLTNDLSALALNGTTNYAWTVRINYTATNALATTWDSRIEWVGLASTTPDLTVTGRYEFAMSTACGTNIMARQVYPTVYPWVLCASGARNSATVDTISMFKTWSDTARTNDYICLSSNFGRSIPFILKLNLWTTTSWGITNAYFYADWIRAGFTPSYSSNKYLGQISVTGETVFKAYIPSVAIDENYSQFLAITLIKYNALLSVSFSGAMIRQSNELERKAYSHGWRP